MQRRYFSFALISLFSTAALSAGSEPQESSPSGSEAVMLRLLKIVDQAGTIIPGVGFKSIRIGDPVEKLVKSWGQPKKVSKKGIIKKKAIISYLLSSNTMIHFVASPEIESIVVQGGAGSLARVNNGVVFGMQPAQVLDQFGRKPDKQTATLIRYDRLGIELGFPQGTLSEILVFSPDS